MFPPTNGHLGVKICGFRDPGQIARVLDLGADAIGINLWPKSKRYMPLEDAQRHLAEIALHHHLVAVLVNPDETLLAETIRSGLFRTLQLHGDESPALVTSLIERGVNVIKAFQIRDAATLEQIGLHACTDVLLDAYNPGSYGGGGHVFPWDLAEKAAAMYPDKRIILSGGLTPANVAQAVAETHPAAVDVASGVESAPGIKDLALVAEFIRSARLPS